MRNHIGGIRRSHVVTTWGPGAIIDFRAPQSGAALSGVLASLEEWDKVAGGAAGLLHPQVIHEPRLEKRLGVQGFRLPPVKPSWKGEEPESTVDVLPVVRFPEWLQCPRCNRLKRADDWNKDPGRPERWCGACREDDDKAWVVPVRFIVACADGHLEDFPWSLWVQCRCPKPALSLEMRGPGLGGKVVRCGVCKRERSMEGAFQQHSLQALGTRCHGREPWIAGARESSCAQSPRVLQRGASNVYWGVLESALDIPPFSPDPSAEFGPYWPSFRDSDPESWPVLLAAMKLPEKLGKPAAGLLRTLTEWTEAVAHDAVTERVEAMEYQQFRRSLREPVDLPDFETRPARVPRPFASLLGGVVLARRLREVRVQRAFTRVHPPGGMFRARQQQEGLLSHQALPWLPAIELRGEGIFLEFSAEALASWESRDEVRAHFDAYCARLRDELTTEVRTPEEAASVRARVEAWRRYGARFVLLHSFSHALMRRLALDCGYGSSALRERLYVDAEPLEMAGVLIHTDSPDSEGTLGGLVRQGQTERLWDTLVGVLREAAWCSSDPVCITGTLTLSTPKNGAACHACLLAPETSCQHFNTLLDRTFLVGTDASPRLGFFRELLQEIR